MSEGSLISGRSIPSAVADTDGEADGVAAESASAILSDDAPSPPPELQAVSSRAADAVSAAVTSRAGRFTV
ncbi:hypothetical protein [Streptomyces sp. NPDC050164]|uniref:hypothetical protein n=1 Tax=Streptomyces sp. NPDC050164 TaxID=3365605 RepID=UPI003796D4CF